MCYFHHGIYTKVLINDHLATNNDWQEEESKYKFDFKGFFAVLDKFFFQ